jgi:hypothetical protein
MTRKLQHQTHYWINNHKVSQQVFKCEPSGMRLILYLYTFYNVKSRAALSRKVSIAEATICRYWCGHQLLSEISLLRIHEVTQLPVSFLRQLCGVTYEYHLQLHLKLKAPK